MKSRLLLLLSGICLVLSHAALAGFTIINAQPAAAASPQTAAPPAMMDQTIGTATAVPMPSYVVPNSTPGNMVSPPGTAIMASVYPPTVVNGFGRDIPLSIAVKQIVPPGAQVKFDTGVDPTVLVTWHGGKAWQDVLADTARSKGLVVSENTGYLVISNPVKPTQPYSYPNGYPTVIPAAGAPGMLSQPVAAPGAVPVQLAPLDIPTWTAKNSDTLHQTLEAWCKKAGVTLRWDSEYDYPLETDISLTGDFETSVRTLLRGLKNANPRPLAQYYRGKDGVPGVLLIPSAGSPSSGAHLDSASSAPDAPPAMTPAAALQPISNMQ